MAEKKTRARRPTRAAGADFAGKAERQEIAASRDGRDIARGWLSGLQLAPVDDTILLMRGGGTDPTMVGLFFIALCVVSILAILLAPESFQKTLAVTTDPADETRADGRESAA